MSAFSDNLVRARKKAGLTQRELAERLGITPTRLNYWEKGKREPDISMISNISTVLNVNPAQLIGWTEANKKENDTDYFMDHYVRLALTEAEFELIEDYKKLNSAEKKILPEFVSAIMTILRLLKQ